MSQRSAHPSDLNLQRVLLHDDPRPDAAENLIFGDEIADCLHQHLENIEGTVSERNRHAVDNELALIREQLAAPEPNDSRASFSLWHGNY